MLCARVRNRMLLAPVNFLSCKGYIAITRTVNGVAASLPLLGMIYRGGGVDHLPVAVRSLWREGAARGLHDTGIPMATSFPNNLSLVVAVPHDDVASLDDREL